ncbi:MAG: DUF302 domain-containing protein [Sulfurimonas sp.]|nr:DUF302 domain-containing protein [Sulfurimonas sp.]MDD3836164.1 DUF302 domain-containing protein [Sulfurimonas sp.]
MKSIIKKLVVALMLAAGVVASGAQDIQIYTADNSKGAITGASIEKAFADAGFVISGNNDMNVAFKSKFQKTNHKMYHLFTLYKKELVLELVKITPEAALFAPLSMSIYMKEGSNDISISSISLEGMAKVTGIPVTNKHMVEYSKLIRATLAKALPNGHFEKTSYKILTPRGELVTSFTGEMEAQGDDVEDELEGLQTELEGSVETLGFVIAGYNKLGDEFAEAGYDKYDFFDAYSICKLPVIFEVAKTHPEAGAFAPCVLYMYKEKGSTKVKMAYPSVYNWISSLDIEDKPSIEVLEDAQKALVGVINETLE